MKAPVWLHSIFSVAWSCAELALIYAALVGQSRGAGNLVVFFACLVAITGLFIIHSAGEAKDSDKRPASVHVFCTAADYTQAFALAWFGWFWCATAYMLGAIASQAWRFRKHKSE